MAAVARSDQEAPFIPSFAVASRSPHLSRWALVPSPARADRSGDEAASPGIDEVVVRHTFIDIPGTPEVTPKRRANSAPPPPDSCDRQADALCAITYMRPAEGQSKSTKGTARGDRFRADEEESQSVTSTATPDVDAASAAASEEVVTSLPNLFTVDTSNLPSILCGGDFSTWQNSQGEWQQEEACAVPLDAMGMPTSIGSIGHMQGICKPCVFAHHASKVCGNGVACIFCHFEHAPKQKRRQRHM